MRFKLVLKFVDTVAECLEITHIENLASDVEVQSEELDVLHLGSLFDYGFHVAHGNSELVFCQTCCDAVSYTHLGGTPAIPVGTIYVGYGDKNDVRVVKLTEDFGRDINLAIATNTALKGMLEFLKEHAEELKKEA